MTRNNGVFLASAMLLAGVLAGCGDHNSGVATKDERFDPSFVESKPKTCTQKHSGCAKEATALLAVPNNVVYQTRADLIETENEKDVSSAKNSDTLNEIVTAPEQPEQQN